MRIIKIIIYDEDSNDISLNEHNGKWEIKLELDKSIDDDNESRSGKTVKIIMI